MTSSSRRDTVRQQVTITIICIESSCCHDDFHQVSVQANEHMVLEEMPFEEFQDGCYGGHPVYLNGIILTNLNFHNAQMPHTNFQFNLT